MGLSYSTLASSQFILGPVCKFLIVNESYSYIFTNEKNKYKIAIMLVIIGIVHDTSHKYLK